MLDSNFDIVGMAEEWRPVAGWEGLYDVSSLGCVLSLPRQSIRKNGVPLSVAGRLLKTTPGNHGYPVVGLCSPNVRGKKRLVHRLVCEAFHGPPPFLGAEVAHRNGKRDDPRSANLRWSTRKENEADKAAHGCKPRGEAHYKAKLSNEEAAWVRDAPKRVLDRQLALILNLSRPAISMIRSGRTWQHLKGGMYDDTQRWLPSQDRRKS